MQELPYIHCQALRRQRTAETATRRAADPSLWLPIRAGCILGTVRFLPYLGGFSFAVEQNLLWVEGSGRPDVYDLGRVLRHEGPGEACCGWSQVSDTAQVTTCVLDVEVKRPVRASFGLRFSLPDDLRLLASIAHIRSLDLCFGDPPDIREKGDPIADSHLGALLHDDTSERLFLKFDWLAQDELHQCLVRWLKEDSW